MAADSILDVLDFMVEEVDDLFSFGAEEEGQDLDRASLPDGDGELTSVQTTGSPEAQLDVLNIPADNADPLLAAAIGTVAAFADTDTIDAADGYAFGVSGLMDVFGSDTWAGFDIEVSGSDLSDIDLSDLMLDDAAFSFTATEAGASGGFGLTGLESALSIVDLPATMAVVEDGFEGVAADGFVDHDTLTFDDAPSGDLTPFA